jgi:hypothetical protein
METDSNNELSREGALEEELSKKELASNLWLYDSEEAEHGSSDEMKDLDDDDDDDL